MPESFLDPGGLVIPPSALKLRRSRETARVMQARDNLFSSLVECRRAPGAEMVVFDIEPQRPQVLASPIKAKERVAAIFPADDKTYPTVISLRSDFPQVLHLNQGTTDFPRSLCLYERPWPEIRVNWTGPTFIERVRWWFAGTARGNLHEDDQPLEPLLLASGHWLVVPNDLPAAMTPCAVSGVGGPEGRVIIAKASTKTESIAGVQAILIRFESPPRQHGISPRAPQTLQDLCNLLATPGFDLLVLLREVLKSWPKERESELAAKVLLLIDLPKIKEPGGPVLVVDRKAFLTTVDGLELGVAIGVWTLDGRKRAVLLRPDETQQGQGVKIFIANVTHSLTPDAAAIFNGREQSNPLKVFAVGAGALGSQVILNLVRAGFGRWTIIDNDQVLPHNLARHALDGAAVGFDKSQVVAITANSLFGTPCAESITADILDSLEHAPEINTALAESDLVLDLSASVPVARHLAHASGGPRRMSVFLSPSGRDLVILCEDCNRATTIDQLEMTYYAAVAADQRLNGHLDRSAGRRRYGLSCRDIAGRIAQADVGTFAGIAARTIPQVAEHDDAFIRVWRSDADTGAVSVLDIVCNKWHQQTHGDWTILVTERLLADIARWRLERLPNETGGIVVGGIDHEQRMIYMLHALPSPPDSEEWPNLYIRGTGGMEVAMKEMVERTAANIVYLGEWHSHPEHHRTLPSSDDLIVLNAVADRVGPAGQPGLILIAGDGRRARVVVEGFDPTKPMEELCLD